MLCARHHPPYLRSIDAAGRLLEKAYELFEAMTEEDHPKLVIEKVFIRNGYALVSSGAATSTQPPGVASRSQHRWRILPILFCRPYVSSKTAQPTAAPDASVTSRPPHQRDGLRPLRQELFDAGDGAAPVQCFGGLLERSDAVPKTEQIVTHACRPAHWIGHWIAQEHDLRSGPPCVDDAQPTQ